MSTRIQRVSADAIDTFQSYAVGDRVIVTVNAWGIEQPERVDRLALVAGYGFKGDTLQVKVQIIGCVDDDPPAMMWVNPLVGYTDGGLSEMLWVDPLSTDTNLRKV